MLIDLVLTFFVEYHDPNTMQVEKRFIELCKLYLKGDFIFDFLAIIPFYELLMGKVEE